MFASQSSRAQLLFADTRHGNSAETAISWDGTAAKFIFDQICVVRQQGQHTPVLVRLR
jgi:hypothetical protein